MDLKGKDKNKDKGKGKSDCSWMSFAWLKMPA